MEDAVVDVFSLFDSLPRKGKPQGNEWTTMAAVVMVRADGSHEIVSLATGVKCLTAERVHEAQGRAVNDSHAEVLAIRGFNRFLLHQVEAHGAAEWLTYAESDSLPSLKPGVQLYLYVSEIPCGDASMECTMALQQDDTPWPDASSDDAPRGRAYFSRLGCVRYKPSRGDAPPTSVVSCSDKLSMRQCTGLLLAPLRGLISPRGTYLSGIILHHRNNHGCQRAWHDRMRALHGKQWPGGYAYHSLPVVYTAHNWIHSRKPDRTPAPASIVYVRDVGMDVLIHGIRQGSPRIGDPRFSMRFASMCCPSMLAQTALDLHAQPCKRVVEEVKKDVKLVLHWPNQ